MPSLVTVHGHCGVGVETTYDHHCVSVGIRDGAGQAVINNVIYKLNINLTAFNTYVVSYLSGKPVS